MRGSRMMILGRWCSLAAMVVMVLSLSAGADTSARGKPIGTEAQQQRWLSGLALVGAGQTAKAAEVVHRLITDGVADERVRLVDDWLADFERLQAERAERIQSDYEQYVNWAKEDMDKGRWHEVVRTCRLAFKNVRDQDAFRKEPWLIKAVEGTAAAALEYEDEGKWYRAAGIHARLTEIFPHNRDYREALDRCQEHIRIELMYEPKSDWEAMVSGITSEMARDAFRKIATDYLKEPAFKDAAIGGLKQLLLMAGEPQPAGVFKALDDQDAVSEFRIRVNENLKKAKQEDELTVDDLTDDFDNVLTINEEVQLFPEAVLIHEFVHGALEPLDKFSDMIWPAEVQEFNKHTQGKFSGVGIQIRKPPGEPILVVSPLKDSPAYAKGIRPGDLITKINGKPASKYSITRAVREITGPVGTTVTLTIKRPGREDFEVKLERQEITIHTIKGFDRDEEGDWKFIVDPVRKIGYVRMTNFTEGTFDELRTVLERLTHRQGIRGLIFDLRDNPGGPLKSAVDVADLFLGADQQIVSTLDRHKNPWQVSSSTEPVYADFPLVVLVSKYSASASEIVAGALQVHKRAVIVGERTYGKGSVQQVLLLNRSRSAFLKLTTALYYLPNGRCLHKDEDSTTWGVDPDIEARLVPKERVKLSELQLKREILKGKNQSELTDEDLRHVTDYHGLGRSDDQDEDRETEGPDSSEPLTDTAPADEEAEHAKGDEGEDEEDDELDTTRTDPNDYPEIDPQLEEALLLMRVWLETDQAWPTRPAEIAATPAAASVGG